MSGDKRSVATDALETLGTIINDKAGRDAIHLAVNPTQAKEVLMPGESVGVDGTSNKPWVGIVDPFLKSGVAPGEWFWLIIYPRQITSLRHVWEHPSFPPAAPAVSTDVRAASLAWLRTFAIQHDNFPVDYLIDVAVNHNTDGDALCFAEDICGEIPEEFYDHVEVVSGHRITNRPKYFSCAC